MDARLRGNDASGEHLPHHQRHPAQAGAQVTSQHGIGIGTGPCATRSPSPLRGGVRGGGKPAGVARAASPHPAQHAQPRAATLPVKGRVVAYRSAGARTSCPRSPPAISTNSEWRNPAARKFLCYNCTFADILERSMKTIRIALLLTLLALAASIASDLLVRRIAHRTSIVRLPGANRKLSS